LLLFVSLGLYYFFSYKPAQAKAAAEGSMPQAVAPPPPVPGNAPPVPENAPPVPAKGDMSRLSSPFKQPDLDLEANDDAVTKNPMQL
jgi:hypothetical protein